MISDINKKIWTVENKNNQKLLRKRLADFDFSKYSKKEINELIKFMRKMMAENGGVGLAANQIGFNFRVFVAQLPEKKGEERGYVGKFYAVFNPEIISLSEEKINDREGCLSIPGFYGEIERSKKMEIGGFDKNQRPVKIKAGGFLARIFQHEIDHLNGTLFTDHVHFQECL